MEIINDKKYYTREELDKKLDDIIKKESQILRNNLKIKNKNISWFVSYV